jgi:hypothetical protein
MPETQEMLAITPSEMHALLEFMEESFDLPRDLDDFCTRVRTKYDKIIEKRITND